MINCLICSEYLGLITFNSYCETCAELRRLTLVIGKDKFLSMVRQIFINSAVLEYEDKPDKQTDKLKAVSCKDKDVIKKL